MCLWLPYFSADIRIVTKRGFLVFFRWIFVGHVLALRTTLYIFSLKRKKKKSKQAFTSLTQAKSTSIWAEQYLLFADLWCVKDKLSVLNMLLYEDQSNSLLEGTSKNMYCSLYYTSRLGSLPQFPNSTEEFFTLALPGSQFRL